MTTENFVLKQIQLKMKYNDFVYSIGPAFVIAAISVIGHQEFDLPLSI